MGHEVQYNKNVCLFPLLTSLSTPTLFVRTFFLDQSKVQNTMYKQAVVEQESYLSLCNLSLCFITVQGRI